ncbi:MAG: radical SAM family heme chaperone HemW [Gemmatimonadota bacterium]|nr:radical SAM family heme chaperone HemW [Gemmatimonadota bacterium]
MDSPPDSTASRPVPAGNDGFRHVYVHVPFCSRRCSYCDFSIAVRKDVPAVEFSTSIGLELGARNVLKRCAGRSGTSPVDTLYLGGGTPSKLGEDGIRTLLETLARSGVVPAPGAEVTMEANPEDVTPGSAAAWVAAGINRLSIGIQSFSPETLTWMHRTHDSAQAAAAVQSARLAGIANISIDLIYAVPAVVRRSWRDDLDLAIALEPDHVSAYGLTVEPRTPLGRWTARGTVEPRPADQAADEFLEAHAVLSAAGFQHYEVSNYARPGFRSRHNSAYWRRVPYLGLGPSAHSFDGAVRRWNVPAWAAWQVAVASGSDPVEGDEVLGDRERLSEEVYLGLRTDSGYEVTSDADLEHAARWVKEGWARVTGRRVHLTPEGWLRLDALAASLSGS